MKSLEEEGYKCLGIIEMDDVKHGEIKKKLKREYLRRARKISKSKLNAGTTT